MEIYNSTMYMLCSMGNLVFNHVCFKLDYILRLCCLMNVFVDRAFVYVI